MLSGPCKSFAVRTLPTYTFFYGMQPGKQIADEIGSGKRLEIVLQMFGSTSDTGQAKIYFELNSKPREITVLNRSIKVKVAARAKTDTASPLHIVATIPVLFIGLVAKVGQQLARDDVILQLDAMKTQTMKTAERAGTFNSIHAKFGDQVEVKDLVARVGFQRLSKDVRSGDYPKARHEIKMAPDEFDASKKIVGTW